MKIEGNWKTNLSLIFSCYIKWSIPQNINFLAVYFMKKLWSSLFFLFLRTSINQNNTDQQKRKRKQTFAFLGFIMASNAGKQSLSKQISFRHGCNFQFARMHKRKTKIKEVPSAQLKHIQNYNYFYSRLWSYTGRKIFNELSYMSRWLPFGVNTKKREIVLMKRREILMKNYLKTPRMGKLSWASGKVFTSFPFPSLLR